MEQISKSVTSEDFVHRIQAVFIREKGVIKSIDNIRISGFWPEFLFCPQLLNPNCYKEMEDDLALLHLLFFRAKGKKSLLLNIREAIDA